MNFLFTQLVLSAVFMEASAVTLEKTHFEFYTYYVIFAVFLVLYSFRLPRLVSKTGSLLVWMALLGLNFVNASFLHYSLFLVLKQALGISLTGLAFYLILQINNWDYKKLFTYYLNMSVIVSVIGIVQQLGSLLNLEEVYDFSWFLNRWWLSYTYAGLLRINSVASEPSHLAILLAPAMFVAVRNIFFAKPVFVSRGKALVIIATYLMTFSAVGFFGMLASALFILYRKRYFSLRRGKAILLAMILAPAIGGISYGVYLNVPDIKERVDDTVAVMQGKMYIERSQLSTYALITNLYVSLHTLKAHPLLGTGLGTHIENYFRFISAITPRDVAIVNAQDANSLLLRLMSETGLFGLALGLWFLGKYFVSSSEQVGEDEAGIINNAIFVMILLRLLRFGHYFSGGAPLFYLFYYLSKLEARGPRESASRDISDPASEPEWAVEAARA